MPAIKKISISDMERMRATVRPPPQTDKEAHRQQLRQMSQTRTGKWPNTLEAMRRKKDNWKKDKEAREENNRLEIDAHERHLQKEARLGQIEKANRLLYEQTDKMKTLRSKRLQCDVIQDRQIQIQEKKFLQDQELVREKRWEAQLVQQLKDADKKELRDKEAVQKKNAEMAAGQQEQLSQVRQNFITRLQEEKAEGERIKAKAIRDIEEEEEAERRRRQRAKQANEETRIANERLQALRAKEKDKERLEELKREDDARKKEAILNKRNELQRIKNEKTQARKQRMIDLAIEHLSKLETSTEKRLENQAKEVQEKQDKELRYRAHRRELERKATDDSRNYQLQRIADKKARERQEAAVLASEWVERNANVEYQMKLEEQGQETEARELSYNIKAQHEARATLAMEQNAAKMLGEAGSKQLLDQEDAKYRQVAKATLDQADTFGIKNKFPLKTALAAKSIDLLPASGFRV